MYGLHNDTDENERRKGTKKQHEKIKRKQNLKFKDYKNCLEANQHESETKHLKNKTAIEKLKGHHRYFIKHSN